MPDVNTITDDRQMRALTGLDLSSFGFWPSHSRWAAKPKPMRAFRWRSPANAGLVVAAKAVASPEQKLLFLLFYLKTYPTFDVLGATFGLSRSKACEGAHRLAKALERTLGGRACCRPGPSSRWPRCSPSSPRCPLPLDATDARSAGRGPSWTGRPTTPAKKRPTCKNTLIADSDPLYPRPGTDHLRVHPRLPTA